MPTAKTRKATTTKSGTPTAKAAKSGTGPQKRQEARRSTIRATSR